MASLFKAAFTPKKEERSAKVPKAKGAISARALKKLEKKAKRKKQEPETRATLAVPPELLGRILAQLDPIALVRSPLIHKNYMKLPVCFSFLLSPSVQFLLRVAPLERDR